MKKNWTVTINWKMKTNLDNENELKQYKTWKMTTY